MQEDVEMSEVVDLGLDSPMGAAETALGELLDGLGPTADDQVP